MATRQFRLSEFNSDHNPPPDEPVQVLCEDHVGTYLLPFPCVWHDDCWHNPKSGERITAQIVGWRSQQGRTFERAPVERSG